jgi:hypothetical protein
MDLLSCRLWDSGEFQKNNRPLLCLTSILQPYILIICGFQYYSNLPSMTVQTKPGSAETLPFSSDFIFHMTVVNPLSRSFSLSHQNLT